MQVTDGTLWELQGKLEDVEHQIAVLEHQKYSLSEVIKLFQGEEEVVEVELSTASTDGEEDEENEEAIPSESETINDIIERLARPNGITSTAVADELKRLGRNPQSAYAALAKGAASGNLVKKEVAGVGRQKRYKYYLPGGQSAGNGAS